MGNCQSPPLGFLSRRTLVSWNEAGNNDDRVPVSITTTTLSNEIATSSRSLKPNLTQDSKNRDVFKYYEPIKVLGVGSMGSVTLVRKKKEAIGGSARVCERKRQQLCTCFAFRGLEKSEREKFAKLLHAASSQHHSVPSDRAYEVEYALKTIHLNRVSDPAFVAELRNEIDIIKSLDHPNIVRAIETFESKNHVCFLMDLCSGGDLYTRDPYTEEQAQRIVRQVTSAVEYMHRCGIVHRGKQPFMILQILLVFQALLQHHKMSQKAIIFACHV